MSRGQDAARAHGNVAALREPDLETLLRDIAPAPLEPRSVDAFVSGAARALQQATSELPAAQVRELLQRGPLGYRELTLYLPEDLARQLSIHCLEHELDMNRLLADALRAHLNLAAVPARRASDTPLDASLSVAARTLLVELTHWLRATWATRRRALSARVEAAVAAL